MSKTTMIILIEFSPVLSQFSPDIGKLWEDTIDLKQRTPSIKSGALCFFVFL